MARQTVYIIDDDESVRRALGRLVRSAGMEPVASGSVDEFLVLDLSAERCCVVADVRMPGTPSLRLPAALAARGRRMPVIFLTAQDTPQTRAEAKVHGGAAFFRKPVDDQALLDTIAWLAANGTEPCALEYGQ